MLTVLKNSRLFIAAFQKFAMPALDKAFERHKEKCVVVFAQLQKSIQFLQGVCLTHAQTAVAKQTPAFMRSVEAFQLRVKQLLYVNECDQAFSVDLVHNEMPKKAAKKGRAVLSVKTNAKKGKNATAANDTTSRVASDNEVEEEQEESEEEVVESDEDSE